MNYKHNIKEFRFPPSHYSLFLYYVSVSLNFREKIKTKTQCERERDRNNSYKERDEEIGGKRELNLQLNVKLFCFILKPFQNTFL
jgi:hypothetical protein